MKVGKQLRQPKPKPAVVTGELPWWAKTKPGEMTKTAMEQQERMKVSKGAKQVGMRGVNF